MATKKTQTKRKSVWSAEGPARYINPQTSFGLHKLFGPQANKSMLQEFLQALLRCSKITTLRHFDPAQLGLRTDYYNAVYDIYCETSTGEKFVVEMQYSDYDYFNGKNGFYSTFPVTSQANKSKKWNFKIDAVYTIGILDFVFDEDEENKRKYQYIQHVPLSDTETKDTFYNKLTFICLELPNFHKRVASLKTPLDKWIYVLKHLPSLDDRPEVLQERVFERVFRVAEIKNLTPDEQFAYRVSQMHRWDMHNVVETAIRRAKEQKYTAAEKMYEEEKQARIEKEKIRAERLSEQAVAYEKELTAKEKKRAEIANLKSFLKKK
jgi:hypothetical protein